MIISRWLARKRKQEAEIKQSYDRLGPGKYEAYKAKRTRKRLGFVRSLALVWIGVGMAFYIMATGGNALVAFLLYNDGIQTIIAVSAIFARDVLDLPREAVIGCFLMVQFMAMPGALFFGWLAGKWGSKKVILLTLTLFIGVTAFAATITTSLQFWLLGFVVALILGGSQAATRSLFASLIPAGRNAEFFGFYAVSAKFASILGPFVFALLADLTGAPRLSILAMIIFFGLGALLLALVDVEQGRRDAIRGMPGE